MDLYCVLCGGRLRQEDEHVACLGCNAQYTNVLLSETKIEDDKKVITELSLSMDFLVVKEKEEKSALLQLTNCYPTMEAVG